MNKAFWGRMHGGATHFPFTLLLGSVFLLLSIVTMIWYASVNFGWTWLWYVAGIMTGATIIFMFAVFEKKRSEVLRVVEGLKDWER